MHYNVQMVYERADFIGFMQAYTEKNKRMRTLETLTTYGAKMGSALMLFAGVFNFVDMYRGAGFDMKLALASVALIAIGILVSAIPINELSGRRAWNRYEGQGLKLIYDFEAGGFTETRQGNSRKHNYSEIVAIHADEDRYYLYISEASAYIICKRGFKEGDAGEFGKYIENKTGLTMTVKGQAQKPAARTEKE